MVRAGFTLLEIVIVLTIILILASLSWPPLLRYIRERTIREQAHTVRLELNNARIKAIDQGMSYQFRFEPGGRKYVILPIDPPSTGADASVGAGTTGMSTGSAPAVAPVVSGQIAEPCEFDVPTAFNTVTHADQAVVTEKLPEEWLSLLPDGNSLRETSWSPAVRFYADGSADDSTVTVIDDQDCRIDIGVRGFTGSVSAGPLIRERRL
ncbi:MAG: prepilin-type N-terminal cleavage/methylation domain-containing protein [Planctomycetaceae bacterium]|nr:prepilin-type N-terminal cleavage/methylation domain-containing protein [Planctomycetaceae bacterium]